MTRAFLPPPAAVLGSLSLAALSLAFAAPASAVNLTIENTSRNTAFTGGSDLGQSFTNDPSGSGASILLNDWTFAVTESVGLDDVPVENATLSIFEGNGNGGTLVGSSTTSTVTTLASRTATQWTFAGGLSLIDNQRYTAVLVGSGNFLFIFDASNANPYANGFATLGTSGAYGGGDFDAVFSANFSEANPVPEPLTLLGASAAIAFGAGFKRRSNKTTEQK